MNLNKGCIEIQALGIFQYNTLKMNLNKGCIEMENKTILCIRYF